MISLSKNNITLVQIFPEDEESIEIIQQKKCKWIIEVLREKYPDRKIEEAIKILVANQG